MIKSLIRPFIRNQILLNIYSTKKPLVFWCKKYSDLHTKNDIVLQSQISDLTASNENKDSNLNLVINQDFIKMLDQKLNNQNFKSLPYKQDEFNSLIYKLENPFHLFYLYEKYSKEFNSFNLVNVIKKMAFFSRNQKLIENGLFFIPEQINKSLTKQLIKTAPQFESFQCLTVLAKLVQLGYKINDFPIKTMLQLLKFHVNEFDLDDLIRCKEFLQSLRNSPDARVNSNEYADNLDKALNLAVQIKYEELKNVKQSINLLKNFSSSLSDANFERIVNFIYERLMQKDVVHSMDLVGIMAERNFSHLKLFLKIKKNVTRENVSDSAKLKDLHGSFLKIKFYDSEIQDYFIEKQIENAKNSCIDVEIFNHLLEGSLFFVHKSLPLLDFIRDSKLCYENKFSVFHYILYSAQTGFEKITNDLQELVEKFLEENQSDESKISLLKSLCWIDQMSQANKVLSSIQVPQNLNVMDKLFLRDIFNLNSFKIDESLPVKTKLEEKFEETVANLENYEIRWCGDSIETASYFKNFEIFDRNSNTKCVVQFTGLNEKFRNIGDNTNSFTFKKNHLIKLIQNENEKGNCRYWIFEARKYQNLGLNFQYKVKYKLDEIFQKIVNINKI